MRLPRIRKPKPMDVIRVDGKLRGPSRTLAIQPVAQTAAYVSK